MKFVVIVALCCGFLWTLSNGFVVIKHLSKYEYETLDSVENGAVAAADVTAILNSLAAADANGAQSGDITLDYQNQASHHDFTHDNAPNPLFKSVSSSLIGKPTFTALTSLLSQYTTPDSGADETITNTKHTAISAFLTSISSTSVYQTASTFLTSNNLITGDLTTALTNLWFQPFARSGSVKGSSGFKSIFAGETSAGNVIGFNNWVQFYTLEKSSAVNYHGWFDRQKDVQISLQFAWGTNQAMLRNFLVGTSPEFEFLAYTICGLAGTITSGTTRSCAFTLQGNDVTLTVDTVVVNGNTFISSGTPSIGGGSSLVTYPTGAPGKTTTKKQGGGTDPNLQTLVDKMWSIDEDKAQPGDIVLDWGNKVSGSSDASPNPLFKSVNENLFNRPVYKQLITIYNDSLFIPQVCTAEAAMSGLRKAQLDAYLQLLSNTSVFQEAYKYLQTAGHGGSSFADFYKNTLFPLWFGTYSRCKGPLGSSGWEHVYSGEWKGEEIDGQHNWVRYYLLEKAGQINYHGYFSHENDLIGTFQYTWQSYLKKKGGFLISTSPAFDLSILTTCVLAHSGGNACKFNVNGNYVVVTSYHQQCAAGECISTAYPSDQ
jgi:poly(U)-specific endoribonuclease